MKKASYILKVENFCEQDWETMKQNEAGKFCFQCSKTVVDFTNLSDDEMIALIENAQGRLCGRFNNEQLNRLLVKTKQQNANSNIYKILAGLLLVSSANYVAAQQLPKQEISVIDGYQKINELKEDSSKNIVDGQVIDAKTKKGISFASIVINGTKIGVPANANGEFKLHIPDSLFSTKIVLNISCVGYEVLQASTKEKYFKLKKAKDEPLQNITLGVIITTKKEDNN